MDKNAILDTIKPLRRLVSLQTRFRRLVVRNATDALQRPRDLRLAQRGHHRAAAGRASLDAVAVLDGYAHERGLARREAPEGAAVDGAHGRGADGYGEVMGCREIFVLVRILDPDLHHLVVGVVSDPFGGDVGADDSERWGLVVLV